MQFVFDEEKAAQAAAHLLSRAGGEMYALQLVQLLYLADRQALIETGFPTTGARMVSTGKGPVLAEVAERLAWGDSAETPWTLLIADAADHRARLRKEPDLDQLSAYDIELLDKVYAQWGRWDARELVKYARLLPEWHDPEGASVAIDACEILSNAGFSAEEIKDVAAMAENVRMVHLMLTPAR